MFHHAHWSCWGLPNVFTQQISNTSGDGKQEQRVRSASDKTQLVEYEQIL